MYSEDMKDFMVKVVSRSGLSQKGAPAAHSLDDHPVMTSFTGAAADSAQQGT
jgi:hypothetical protein